MSELIMFNRVPDRSRLNVQVTPTGGPFAVVGQLFTFAGTTAVPDQQWTDAELQSGKRTDALLDSRDYAADVVINFASPTTTSATVTAQIEKPGGATFGKVRKATVTGKNGGSPSTVTIIIVMEA